MTDHRIEYTANKAFARKYGKHLPDLSAATPESIKPWHDEAEVLIGFVDEADRANGIVRVDTRDPATVDRVAREIHGLHSGSAPNAPEDCSVCADSLRKARAVLAALEES